MSRNARDRTSADAVHRCQDRAVIARIASAERWAPEAEAAVCLVGALHRGGGGVAAEHVVAAPAGRQHQVPPLSAAGQPAVGEGAGIGAGAHLPARPERCGR